MTSNQTHQKSPAFQELSSLDTPVIVDQLHHTTRLLLAATVSKLADQKYIMDLREDVEKLQQELKTRQTTKE